MSHKEPAPRGPKMKDGWYLGEAPLPDDPMARLAYYARLAPSSHNAQPWKLVAGRDEIDVFADLARWPRAADPDRRELHLSLGCAIEAMRIAADFAGWGSEVEYFPVRGDDTLVARVRLALAGPKRDDAAADLLAPMLTRHTSHQPFDRAQPLGAADRARLERSIEGEGVDLHLADSREVIERLAALERDADAALLARADYRAELAAFVGEGVFGTPWLVSKLGQFAIGHLPVGERIAHADVDRLASAPLVALLTTAGDGALEHLRAGAAFLRIALAAEAHELRVQPISQLLEVPETRAATAREFGAGGRFAQHFFRIGRAAPEARRTPRRALSEILIRAA